MTTRRIGFPTKKPPLVITRNRIKGKYFYNPLLIYDQLELFPNYENMDDSFDLDAVERTQSDRIELVRDKMAQFSRMAANLSDVSRMDLMREIRDLGQR